MSKICRRFDNTNKGFCSDCKKTFEKALDISNDPRLAPYRSKGLSKTGIKDEDKPYLYNNYGPGASDPINEWIDINYGSQKIIVDIIREVMKETGIGGKTGTFDFVEQNENKL